MDLDQIAQRFDAHHGEVKAALHKTGQTVDGVSERLSSLEQKMARGIGGAYSDPTPRSWGEALIGSDSFKGFMAGGCRGTARIETKAITTAATSAGEFITPDRQPGVVMLPKRRLTIRDLLAPGRTTSKSVEYVRQTGFTNNAAPVAEGAVKPESSITFETDDADVKTIAHWIPVSRQAMETTMNVAGDTELDTLLHVIQQAEEAELPATGIIVNTADFYKLLGLKNAADDYLGGGPFSGQGQRMVWDLPIVATPALAARKFLVGAFATAAQVFTRMDIEVLISSEASYVTGGSTTVHSFIQNMLVVRAETRLALAVKRPEALVYGTFPQT